MTSSIFHLNRNKLSLGWRLAQTLLPVHDQPRVRLELRRKTSTISVTWLCSCHLCYRCTHTHTHTHTTLALLLNTSVLLHDYFRYQRAAICHWVPTQLYMPQELCPLWPCGGLGLPLLYLSKAFPVNQFSVFLFTESYLDIWPAASANIKLILRLSARQSNWIAILDVWKTPHIEQGGKTLL